MSKKSASKQKIVTSSTSSVILALAMLLSFVSVFVVLQLQSEINHMALTEEIFYMQNMPKMVLDKSK